MVYDAGATLEPAAAGFAPASSSPAYDSSQSVELGRAREAARRSRLPAYRGGACSPQRPGTPAPRCSPARGTRLAPAREGVGVVAGNRRSFAAPPLYAGGSRAVTRIRASRRAPSRRRARPAWRRADRARASRNRRRAATRRRAAPARRLTRCDPVTGFGGSRVRSSVVVVARGPLRSPAGFRAGSSCPQRRRRERVLALLPALAAA
jgi:hypothetical protein